MWMLGALRWMVGALRWTLGAPRAAHGPGGGLEELVDAKDARAQWMVGALRWMVGAPTDLAADSKNLLTRKTRAPSGW
eukprot:9073366-Pyramimonas_sp.AAC.2